MLLHPWLVICCYWSLLSFRSGPTPLQCPVIHFPQSDESPNSLLYDLQLYSLPKVLLNVLLLPIHNCSFRSWFLVQLLHFGCARHPSFRGSSCNIVSGPIFPLSISVWPSVLYDCIPYTVPLLHGGSSLCEQQQTSSGTHHLPGSFSAAISGTLQLDVSPHIAPSVLKKIPLWPLL
jgi:hypothetical protein